MQNYTKKIVSGVSIVFVMGIISSVLAYITRIVMARNLTPEEYGLFTSVLTFVMFFLFFRGLGMEKAVSKYIPQFLIHNQKGRIKSGIFFVIGFQLISSIIMVIVFLSLNDYLSNNYFKNPLSKPILGIMVFYIFGSMFFRIYRSIAGGYQVMKLFSLFEFLKNLIILGLFLLFFKLGLGILSAALALALVCYIVVFIITPFLKKSAPFLNYKIEKFWPTAKMIFLFGVPLFATGIAGKLISYIDTLILTHFRSLVEVGVYNVVLPSILIFSNFGASISAVFFPMFSELWTKKDKTRMSEGLKMLHRYLFFIVIPPALGVIVFSEFLILTFFGKAYISGTIALQILMIGAFIHVVSSVNNTILSAIGKPKIVAKIIILVALFNVVTNILLIPKYGIEGAALTTALSYLITLILSTNRVLKHIKIRFPWLVWTKLIFSGFVFFSVVRYLQKLLVLNIWWELVISISVGLMVYLGIAYAYQIVDVDEVKKYWRLVRRKG
jgi:O-antigen/teichoic acid export membrane protein